MTSRIGTRSRGFTLVELIVVMMVLTTVAAIAAPRLRLFLSGRALQEECKRFVAVTRYARSEAVSRGERTEVWIDAAGRRYGMRYSASKNTNVPTPPDHSLGTGLSFQLDDRTKRGVGEVTIAYRPDGTLDDTVLEGLAIKQGDSDGLAVVLSDSRVTYEIVPLDRWTTNEKTATTKMPR